MLKLRALTFWVALTGFAGAVAGAQTQAVVVQSRMTMQTPFGVTDTIVMRTTTAKRGSRVDYLSSTARGNPMLRPGLTQLVMTADSDVTMIFVDSAKKLYAEMRPSAMMGAMGAAGVAVKFDSTGNSTSLDSIGPGPAIVGHSTLHFRTRSVSHMTMTMLGDTSTQTLSVTADLYVAPDVPQDSTGPESAGALKSFGRALPGLEGIAAGSAKERARLTRYGTALRTDTETTETSSAGSRTQHMSMEALSYEKKIVPDSLFSIPAGYRKVGLMDLITVF